MVKSTAIFHLILLTVVALTPYDLTRRELTGIWKLKVGKAKNQSNIVVRLNEDGSFCSGAINGIWDYNDDTQLVLASNRDLTGKLTSACLLDGKVSVEKNANDEQIGSGKITCQGNVCTGKFFYPWRHPSFFEQPMHDRKITDTFEMTQVLSDVQFTSKTKEQGTTEPPVSKFSPSDFINKNFIMTVVPLTNQIDDSSLRNQPVDIRAMSVTFFANNTFTMNGINKLLRGRFHVDNQDRLHMRVSLFGAGRSLSGSVYSEGDGLSHEDERSYVGSIADDMSVEGSVTFGDDLGSDARPEPVGKFLLTPSTYSPDSDDVLDENGSDEESVFE